MCRKTLPLGALLLLLPLVGTARGEIDSRQVNEAIRRGVKFLQREQNKVAGNWTPYEGYPGGVTALCTLALLKSGVPVSDPSVARALTWLRTQPMPEMTYSNSLQTMVFCAAGQPQDIPLIRRNAQWLASIQLKSGPNKGAWSYSDPRKKIHGDGDHSNSQFALLALHEAELKGIDVSQQTWNLALEYWMRNQLADGSWRYSPQQPSSGSMACAGLASLVIASGKVNSDAARIEGDRVICCGPRGTDDAVQRGLNWLGRKFVIHGNPGSGTWLLYYLYGVERVGRLTGRRFLGNHDWYREGAEMLVGPEHQNQFSGSWRGTGRVESVPLISTSFALLFLSKGRRPVVIAKAQYGNDTSANWDRHPAGVHHLTQHVEKTWRQELSWQSVDLRTASLADMMESPVLFLSGSGPLDLTPQQETRLQQFVAQGGFLLAEACCDSKEFDRDFRKLVQKIYPDSPLRLLPPDHAIWFAQEKISSGGIIPLYGVDACCRTSIVYSPGSLSCYWELAADAERGKISAVASQLISDRVKLGGNILTYATNRELKEKLDRPQISVAGTPGGSAQRATLLVPKIQHGGGADDAPNALANLLAGMQSQHQFRINLQRQVLPLSANLAEYPILFIHGRRSFRFTPAERRAIAAYVQRGGYIFGDAICGNPQFADSFRQEMKAIFPDHPLLPLPAEHDIFSDKFGGYKLTSLTIRDPKIRQEDRPLEARLTKTQPILEGIEWKDRLAVVFSPLDISCALENQPSLECKGYVKRDAFQLGSNIVLFGLGGQ